MRAAAACLACLALSGCAPDETLFKYGAAGKVWQLTELGGTPFGARATISFGEDGAVSGHAPCNRYASRQSEPYPWFKLDPIMSTNMACSELAAESAFFTELRRMQLAEVGNRVLILSTQSGDKMIFEAQ